MIKQSEIHDKKLVFGVDFEKKTRRVQKVEKPVVPPTPKPEKLCRFQVLEEVNVISPILSLMGSSQCQHEALENGWCEEHQHAQDGMEIGKKLGYRSVEIAAAFTIIGQGEKNWEAYFERATGKGLATVLDYLYKRIEG